LKNGRKRKDYKMKIKFNKEAEFWKIPRKKLYDIIPAIMLPDEEWILQKWEDYFADIGIPYCTMRRIRTAQIWIEQKAPGRRGQTQKLFPLKEGGQNV